MNRYKQLSLRWKLVLISSLLIFVAFFLFTISQYHLVSKWLYREEQESMSHTYKEIKSYYAAGKKKDVQAEITRNKGVLENFNQEHQRIRIMDEDGRKIADVNNQFTPVIEVPASSEKKQTWQKYEEDNREIVSLKGPITIGDFRGTIEITRELNRFNRMTEALFVMMTFFGIGAIIVSAILGMVISKQLLQPVKELSETMRGIKQKGFQQRMKPARSGDEITELTNIFNEMMDDIESSFTQQKQFVEDASHELRTPIAVLEGHLRLLKRWGKNDPTILEESLDAALSETARLKHLVVELLELSRAEQTRTPKEEMVDIFEVSEQVVQRFATIHPRFFIHLEAQDQGTIFAAISEHHYTQLLLILLDNAVKYTSDHREIEVHLFKGTYDVRVEVKDYGVGIPADEIAHVFQRFYRVDKARSRELGGSGLGLAIAKRLIERYEGTIELKSEEGSGTTVILTLPLLIQ